MRANYVNDEVPFIMATARGEKKERKIAAKAGVSNFITKPFGIKELKKIIIATLEDTIEDDILKERKIEISPRGKVVLNIAHIQITDHLTLGVLKHLIEESYFAPEKFELQTICMSSWNTVQRALEAGEVDAAFILAPIAMNLFASGVPIKLVLFAHKNGSICVRKKRKGFEDSFQNFAQGKSFCIPHLLSIHHMLSHMFFTSIGLNPGFAGEENVNVHFEVVPPIKMPTILKGANESFGFMVAEPLGTKAIAEGTSSLLYLSGELWENHPCCIVAMRDELIEKHPDVVQELVTFLAKSGEFIYHKPESSADIGVRFLDPDGTLGLRVSVLKNVLKEPNGITTNDLFPSLKDLEIMQHYMSEKMGMGEIIDLNEFVDTRFAEEAYHGKNRNRDFSKLKDVSEISHFILQRQKAVDFSKQNLEKEGQYLIFTLEDKEYGVNITHVKEIINIPSIRSVPLSHQYIEGTISLRGEVITITNLKLKFNITQAIASKKIIILEVHDAQKVHFEGIIVDKVSEVVDIRSRNIKNTPTFDMDIDKQYILAVAMGHGLEGLKILLDVNKLFV